jgi:hypothetical protein
MTKGAVPNPALVRTARGFARCAAVAGGVLAAGACGARAPEPAVLAPRLLTELVPPTREYVAFAVSESVDEIARITFGPSGVRVERTIPVGMSLIDPDGPHGVAVAQPRRRAARRATRCRAMRDSGRASVAVPSRCPRAALARWATSTRDVSRIRTGEHPQWRCAVTIFLDGADGMSVERR